MKSIELFIFFRKASEQNGFYLPHVMHSFDYGDVDSRVIIFANLFWRDPRHQFTFNRLTFFLMQKIAVLFLGLAMSIASFGISTAHASGAATFSLSPTNTSVSTGDSFSLSVMVDPSGESLDTARVEIEFDESLLEVTAFDLGSLFPYVSPSNEIDNTAGELSQGAFKFGDPVESSGTFGTITFRALTSGTATISITSDSRLIADGEEMLDTGDLGSSTITIDGEAVESEAEEVTTDAGEEEVSGGTSSATAESDALGYYAALAGTLPSTEAQWDMLHCIAYDDCYNADYRDTAYEVAAITYYNDVFGTNPSSGMDWYAIHALAYTEVGAGLLGLTPLEAAEEEAAEEEVAEEVEEVVEEEEEVVEEEEVEEVEVDANLEAEALVYFGAFYARMPSSGNDWEALHCIAYGGCQGDPRDLQAEEDALVLFGQKYAKMPATEMEWNVLHTIAYTDLLTYDEQGEEAQEEVVEEEGAMEEEGQEEEMTLEQQAIGWFGQLTGELPSSDEDWVAIDYMVHGYTPEEQDLEAESAAVTTFVDAFGALPSSDQDWNIVAAIAYSGAF